jgi:Leucine-rich repeat (LRR) protein
VTFLHNFRYGSSSIFWWIPAKYLENVTQLDLSNNSINSITPAAIENLQKEISLDLSNNELKTFPRPIQTLNPCKIQFGDVILDCNCNNEIELIELLERSNSVTFSKYFLLLNILMLLFFNMR